MSSHATIASCKAPTVDMVEVLKTKCVSQPSDSPDSPTYSNGTSTSADRSTMFSNRFSPSFTAFMSWDDMDGQFVREGCLLFPDTTTLGKSKFEDTRDTEIRRIDLLVTEIQKRCQNLRVLSRVRGEASGKKSLSQLSKQT